MPKDYQEIEKVVEQYAQCIQDMYFLAGAKVSVETWKNTKDFIRNALTTYSNARVEEIIKIAKNMREEIPLVSPPDSEAYMHSLAQFNRVAGKNKTIVDLIKVIKK